MLPNSHPEKSQDAISIRAGRATDQAALDALVAQERLNPNNIHAENFILAHAGDELIGAVQLRRLADGARELGSLVVRADHRGRGVSSRLIDALLTPDVGTVHLVTQRRRAAAYERWGFISAPAGAVPRSVRLNRAKGQLFGGLNALMHGRLPQPLVVLRREAAGAALSASGEAPRAVRVPE